MLLRDRSGLKRILLFPAGPLERVRSGAAAAAAARGSLPPVNVATALAQLEASGFSVFEEWHGLEDDQSLMLIARKC